MTKQIFLGLALVGLAIAPTIAIAGEPEPELKFVEVDLTQALAEAGREAKGRVVIQAPEGAEVVEKYGEVSVSAGDTFHLMVAPERHDIEKDKAYQLQNTVHKHRGFVVDTADAVISESEVMRRVSFFLTANTRVKKETFGCQSKRGAVSFTEAQTRAMLDACRSIQRKK